MQPNEYQQLALVTEFTPDFVRLFDRQTGEPMSAEHNTMIAKLLHAVLGMASEVGEIADALKKHIIYGKALDEINILEEAGDESWYIALALTAIKKGFEEAFERNIAKLKARYGAQFTEAAALNRDLDAERKTLEEAAKLITPGRGVSPPAAGAGMSELKFYRYYLPNDSGREGWADFVLRSDGWFGVVSDYGNYVFHWTHFGNRDFRHFVLGLHDDYVMSKLGNQVFSVDKAINNYKDVIWRRRLNKLIKDRDDARYAWDELENISCETDLHEWLSGAGYGMMGEDYYDVNTRDYPGDLRAFAQKTMPRLKDAIRKEMADENQDAG